MLPESSLLSLLLTCCVYPTNFTIANQFENWQNPLAVPAPNLTLNATMLTALDYSSLTESLLYSLTVHTLSSTLLPFLHNDVTFTVLHSDPHALRTLPHILRNDDSSFRPYVLTACTGFDDTRVQPTILKQ